MDHQRFKQTAIHEAGHAVAHVRLGLDHDGADIVPSEDTGALGGAAGEGVSQVWSRQRAEPGVLAFCAGYAALVAAGYAEGTAHLGTDDDFEQATNLIGYWDLDGTLADWKAKAVVLMSKPENVGAVRKVAEHLHLHTKLDGEYVAGLVDVADGETMEDEFAQYLHVRGRQQ